MNIRDTNICSRHGLVEGQCTLYNEISWAIKAEKFLTSPQHTNIAGNICVDTNMAYFVTSGTQSAVITPSHTNITLKLKHDSLSPSKFLLLQHSRSYSSNTIRRLIHHHYIT
jgi:hypothetical protein